MDERRVRIMSPLGLHARPAAVFVRAAGSAGTPVTIRRADGDPVDAASILAVLALKLEQDDEVLLSGESDVLDRLVPLLQDSR